MSSTHNTDDDMPLTIALTRAPSAQLAHCELSFVDREPIDLQQAYAQHSAYNRALALAGCRVIELPPIDHLADAVFVEDVALVLDEVAIMTRPGAVSRRPESASIAAALTEFRPLVTIESPGTLDGGDILRIDKRIYVGLSERSNTAAIEQLRHHAAAHGYSVTTVPIRGCLHLKSAVTQVAQSTVLLNPNWVDPAMFSDYAIIEVDPAEEHAANAVLIGDQLIYPKAFPRTAQRLAQSAIEIIAVDVSELQKAEGAVTCCSLVFAGLQGAGSTPGNVD